MFGNTEVWVAVTEWTGDDDVHIRVAPTKEQAAALARQDVIKTMNSTVPEYNPDGCRVFVLTDSDLDDEAWLEQLHLLTTVPWVTIERHLVEINPASK